MKIPTLLIISLGAVLAGCVQLTPAGAQVRLVEVGNDVNKCQFLGRVFVSSDDALRNAAAALSGDTAVKAVRDIGGNVYIHGAIYLCNSSSSLVPKPIQPVSAPVEPYPTRERIDHRQGINKPERCNQKGGRWTGNLCVIDLD